MISILLLIDIITIIIIFSIIKIVFIKTVINLQYIIINTGIPALHYLLRSNFYLNRFYNLHTICTNSKNSVYY